MRACVRACVHACVRVCDERVFVCWSLSVQCSLVPVGVVAVYASGVFPDVGDVSSRLQILLEAGA